MTPLPGQLAFQLNATDVAPICPAQSTDVAPAGDVARNVRCAPVATFANAFLRGAFYRGFTPDTSEREARALFRQRYGYEPAIVARGLGGILLAGPLREAGR